MAAHQAPPSLGFSRQEHWSGLSFPSPMHERKSESEVSQSCPTLSNPMLAVDERDLRCHLRWAPLQRVSATIASVATYTAAKTAMLHQRAARENADGRPSTPESANPQVPQR